MAARGICRTGIAARGTAAPRSSAPPGVNAPAGCATAMRVCSRHASVRMGAAWVSARHAAALGAIAAFGGYINARGTTVRARWPAGGVGTAGHRGDSRGHGRAGHRAGDLLTGGGGAGQPGLRGRDPAAASQNPARLQIWPSQRAGSQPAPCVACLNRKLLAGPQVIRYLLDCPGTICVRR